VGVTVRDMLRSNVDFLADVGFSNTARKGYLLAGHILRFEGFLSTSGASLPVTAAAVKQIHKNLERMFKPATNMTRLTPAQEADLAAMVIRSCLETGASSHIAYAMPGEAPSRSSSSDSGPVRVRANRNDPCPCGSGRKYKSCCGKR